MKPKIIIWGGWWDESKPHSVENINSHASVTAYFLTKYLAEFYEIANIYRFDDIDKALEHGDAKAILSSFSHGFTRLVERDRQDKYRLIRDKFRGRLCSVDDGLYPLRYREDILFPITPPEPHVKFAVKNMLAPHMVIERLGWPAEPKLCYPEPAPKGTVNIFVDHGWYRKGLDCSNVYFDAFNDLKRLYPGLDLNIFRQNNTGIERWTASRCMDESRFSRRSKVPYLQMLGYYRKTHIFCVTHPESAGIAAIEAAMCGAKLYVPVFLNRSFISKGLLKDGVEYSSVRCSKKFILAAFRDDLDRGFFDREKWRQKILNTNTWKKAAETVYRTLSGALKS